jgi:hypothetical protein
VEKTWYCLSVKTMGALPIGVAFMKLNTNIVQSGRRTAMKSHP